ncbi:MAG: hypothetical protein V3S08_11180 [Phycisphaerales bacterium]
MNEQAPTAIAVEAEQASALEVWLRHKPRGSRIGLRKWELEWIAWVLRDALKLQ